MTWTLVQKSPELAATSTTVSPALGVGSTAGNLLTCKLINAQGTATWTLPAGWVKDAGIQNGGISHSEIWHLPPASNPGGITSVLCTSSVSANIKGVVSEYHTDVTGATVVVNATGTGLAGAVSSCPVTTGTAAAAGDLAECCFHQHFTTPAAVTWNNPAGFTLSQADTVSAGQHLYSGYNLSASSGAMTVTGSTGTVSDNAHGWTGVVVTYTAVPPGGGAPGLVGAYVNPGMFGTGVTQQQANSLFITETGRSLDVRRVYYPGVPATGQVPADMLADAAAGRKVAISFRPAWNPPTTADLSTLDTFLSNCKAAGLVMDVSLYPEPYGAAQAGHVSAGMTISQEIAAWQFYAPTVGQYFPRVFNTSIYSVNHSNENAWYPGDAYIDKVVTDIYCSEYDGGERLDLAASVADSASPAKPFGVWEFNTSTQQTQAQAVTFYNYLQTYFTARLRAGKANADLILFNSDSVPNQETPMISASDPRIPLYQALYDALSGAGGGGPHTFLLDVSVTATATITAGITGSGAPVPLPGPGLPPLPSGQPVLAPLAAWSWTVGPRQPVGGQVLALTEARNRSVTFRVAADQAHEASFAIDGTHPQAASFHELTTDLQIARNGVLLAALRIVPTADQLDAPSQHVTTVTALDYREVLRQRLFIPPATLTWAGTDQSLIAWQMISGTQGQPGGDLGIVRGLGQSSGKIRNITVTRTDTVGDKISEMGLMGSGFDWDVTPYGTADLRLDIWPGQRGLDRGVVLEHGGGLVQSITRNVDPTTFGNAFYVTGDSSVTPVYVEAAGIASDPAGRWDRTVGTQIRTPDALASRADFLLADGQVVIPAYTIVLQPGTWGGPGHIWLGDLVTVRIKSGRLAVNDKLRVMELKAEVSDEGDETVTLTIGRIFYPTARLIRAMLKRLKWLESL
jgi:hypothetical protein